MRLQKRLALIGSLFLAVFSAGTAAFMLVEGWPFLDALYMTTIIIEGELRDVLGKRRMEKALARLHGHVIVCGAGETGKHVVEELLKTHTPCVVIE